MVKLTSFFLYLIIVLAVYGSPVHSELPGSVAVCLSSVATLYDNISNLKIGLDNRMESLLKIASSLESSKSTRKSPTEPLGVSGSVCVLKDAPQQCGAFCMSALRPLFDDLRNITLKVESQRTTLESIVGQQRKLDTKLDSMQDQLMTTVRNAMEGQLATLKDFISNRTFSVEPKAEKIISPLFQLVGQRRFYIEHNDWKTWQESIKTCRIMGGNLAVIENEQEWNLIKAQLKKHSYWLGIYKIGDDYKSSVTGKPAPFVELPSVQPSHYYQNRSCVLAFGGISRMFAVDCEEKMHFICQLL